MQFLPPFRGAVTPFTSASTARHQQVIASAEADRFQCLGIGVRKPREPRLPLPAAQLWNLQRDDRGIRLADVAAGTGGDDRHLDPSVHEQRPRLVARGEV